MILGMRGFRVLAIILVRILYETGQNLKNEEGMESLRMRTKKKEFLFPPSGCFSLSILTLYIGPTL